MDDSLPLQARLQHCADCAPKGGTSRRGFLLGALGSATLAACSTPMGMGGVTSSATPINLARSAGRIDVHHHASPPAWVNAMRGQLDPLATNWSVQKTLADMDAAGIRTSVLSITTPGIVIPTMERMAARRFARECNEWQAQLVRQYPDRFGFFAALPMLDTEGALQEIAYSMDTLKADGIGLMTSYEDKWLGDPSFFPIMEELNRRGAVVYTHPTAAACCRATQTPKVQPVMIEFGTDTTRTIASILFNGNAQRYPNIRWIFSHAGGTMPFLYERFVRNPILDPSVKPLFPEGVLPVLQRFYYDTAQTANAPAMLALSKIIPLEHIVFGSDFPYRTSADNVRQLREIGVFTDAQLTMIERTNPQALIPRLRA